MPVDLTKPLDDLPLGSPSPEVQALLAGLQGGILKGHGREHSMWLLFKFQPNQRRARAWLGQVARGFVTSAAKQWSDTNAFRSFGVSAGLFGSVLLSKPGYDALGLASVAPPGTQFQAGMKASGAFLKDPAPSTWDPVYQGPVHALVLLAHDSEQDLAMAARSLLRLDTPGLAVELVGSEVGRVMRNQDLSVNEQFGYADGISQPLFLESDIQSTPKVNYDPSAPLDLVLVLDPASGITPAYGSYFVFRKLEQNVASFDVQEEALATALGLVGDDRELAGALAVGRFENGTPVVLSGAEEPLRPPARPDNDFDYSSDPAGNKCPYHAHIRVMNDRTVVSRPKRIARRGMTYGKRGILPKDSPPEDMLPQEGFGLLFACYQADIGGQFEVLQAVFANPAGDPVIGQDSPAPTQDWPTVWGGVGRTAFQFGQHVTLKGGEYFFAPSLRFLQGL